MARLTGYILRRGEWIDATTQIAPDARIILPDRVPVTLNYDPTQLIGTARLRELPGGEIEADADVTLDVPEGFALMPGGVIVERTPTEILTLELRSVGLVLRVPPSAMFRVD